MLHVVTVGGEQRPPVRLVTDLLTKIRSLKPSPPQCNPGGDTECLLLTLLVIKLYCLMIRALIPLDILHGCRVYYCSVWQFVLGGRRDTCWRTPVHWLAFLLALGKFISIKLVL